MSTTRLLLLALLLSTTLTQAQTPQKWSERMAATLMLQHDNGLVYDKTKPERWNYELGVMLVGIEQIWHKTGDAKYFNYIQKLIDAFVQEDGTVRTYVLEDYNLDMLPPARLCLTLYKVTGKEKYKKAAQTFRSQLLTQPRTKDSGFWHKKRYPYQMWLDGLYMAEPFFAEYSLVFNELQNFDEVANQLVLMEKNAVDAKTGLLFHAYNEDKAMPWADKKTGHSPHFWGRAMGWYAMALVDVLDYFPTNHPKRAEIEAILKRTMDAAIKFQDPKSGTWYQVMDKQNEVGNYLEASGSSMFCYALLKGVRQGVLSQKYLVAGKKAYAGILKEFISTDGQGYIHLNHVCMVAGLGGTPYRDGSYNYYITEPQRTDDIKGAGPFIMASVEMENLSKSQIGKGKTVVLDYFFNHEFKKDAKTNEWTNERFHYTWEGGAHGEFTFLGHIFRNLGAKTDSLAVAPTVDNLKNADVYIIVDPDSYKETPTPQYVEAQHVEAIKTWVRNGGVLMLMANDTANCDIPHTNNLSKAFGVEFTSKNLHMVKNDQYEQGLVKVPANHAIFKTAKRLFIKELSVLKIKSPAKAEITEGSDVLIATAKYGKGTVFIIGDPWLYNEYMDGRKMQIELGYENFKAANDLAAWLLAQTKK